MVDVWGCILVVSLIILMFVFSCVIFVMFLFVKSGKRVKVKMI